MKQLNVKLDWFANTGHAGFLLADELGYYKEEDLEVTFNGEVHYTMDGKVFDIMVGPATSMLIEMADTGHMIGIGQLHHQQDSGLISLASANIQRPRDLEGKNVTNWGNDWFDLMIGEFMKNDGGDYSQVKTNAIDVGDPLTTLGHTTDVIWIYKYWEWFVMKHAGIECNYLAMRDYGHPCDYPSPAIAAQRSLLEEDEDALRRFMAASGRGYKLAAEKGSEILPTIRHRLPEVDEAILTESLDYLKPLILDPNGEWGHLDVEAWNVAADLLQANGFFKGELPHPSFIDLA